MMGDKSKILHRWSVILWKERDIGYVDEILCAELRRM